ncbi:glycoside hydrolase family 2 protein [Patulibacter sp.]|uniref:glycoside hydrolase family 2 protein n=1 Tax=Patulibacter sp. TaxID=1912859 RepID=UPI0027227D4B|nr:glycoside hydrolase family 2 TIM barrel-domain containing protein [Patulibacter sp.]MDO9409327.1 glycoside hydrolase family 2 TIM barrel-domain containing protein [Patulibacter sp.]
MSLAPRRTLLILVPVVLAAALLAILLLPGGTTPSRAAAGDASEPTKPVTISGPFGRIALGGPWTVAEDARDRGLKSGWRTGSFSGKDVTIPYVPNAGRITGAGGVISHRGSIAWYRTKIQVDSDGQYAIAFGSVNHHATVWVDGRKVADHTGEFLPFDARTSLKAGEHTLVVRADWRDPEKMKAQGWHRLWFNFGGINREVTIRKLGPSEVQAPYVTTTLQGGAAKVRVSAVVVNRSVERDVQLTGVLRRDGQDIAVQFPAVRLKPKASQRVQTEVTVQDPALWAPGSPNLYDLTLAVPNESAYQTRVGLRQVEKRGTNIFLNGKRITLRGASIHEDAPGYGTGLRPEQMDSLVGDLKEIGANATRAQHPLSPALLERLDAAGILLWQGVGPTDSPGSWKSDTPAKAAVARQRVQTTLDEQQTHPSIIVWNLVNEIARNGGTDNGQVPYIRAMAKKLKTEDPGRLTALDVWATPVKYTAKDPVGGARIPEKMGSVYDDIDAIGVTSYQGWYSDPGKSMAFLKDSIRRFTGQIKRIYAGKVLLLTEFGAEANGENATNRPGGYGYQANLLKTTIDAYSSDPAMSGTIVWNLRDFGVAPTFIGGSIRRTYKGTIRLVRGLNQKGLFTYGGRPKPSVAPVKAALQRAADDVK